MRKRWFIFAVLNVYMGTDRRQMRRNKIIITEPQENVRFSYPRVPNDK